MKIFKVISDEPYSNYYISYIAASNIDEAKKIIYSHYSNDECIKSIEEIISAQIIAHDSIKY